MDKNLELELKQLNKSLGVVIALLLKMLPEETKSVVLKDQIMLLDNLGVRPKDIASYLSRNPSYISKELVGIRKQKKHKK